ncbi:phosphopantetheine-binding protein [Azotobacter chroococcum]
MEAPSLLNVAHVQEVIAQFIALQRDQQDTLRRFLDFQSSLAGADLASVGEPRPSLQVVSQAGLAPAPAPVLPAQVLSLHAAALPVGREPQVATIEGSVQRSEVRTEAPKLAVAAAAPAAPAAKSAAPAGVASTEAFKADLLLAVSERTGYPEDMLDLDAHMEADLGIDSIKRIEVLSQLKDRHNLMAGRDEETMFEELTGLKTLNEIVTWYDKLHGSPAAGEGAQASKALTPPSALPAETAESATDVAPEQVVHCYTVKPVAAPLGAVAGPQPAAALPVLLVGADSELAAAFRAALGQAGHAVRQIVPGKENRVLGDGRFEFDPTSLESVQALRGLLGEERIGTLVSLLGVPAGKATSSPRPRSCSCCARSSTRTSRPPRVTVPAGCSASPRWMAASASSARASCPSSLPVPWASPSRWRGSGVTRLTSSASTCRRPSRSGRWSSGYWANGPRRRRCWKSATAPKGAASWS